MGRSTISTMKGPGDVVVVVVDGKVVGGGICDSDFVDPFAGPIHQFAACLVPNHVIKPRLLYQQRDYAV